MKILKRIFTTLLLSVICVSILFSTKVKATGEVTIDEQNISTQENILEISPSDNQTISVKAKIIEAGETYVEEIASYKMKYQKVKVEIKEGAYKGKVVEAKYSVSYDLEGKIEGYPLNKGNTVAIELTIKDGQIDENAEIIVNDIVRSRIFSFISCIVLCINFSSW